MESGAALSAWTAMNIPAPSWDLIALPKGGGPGASSHRGKVMFVLQILVLTLAPIFSGVVPGSNGGVDVPTLVGAYRPPSADFLVGSWRLSEQFMRWGLTDKEKAKIRETHSKAFMELRADGTARMRNLFRPAEGKWEISDRGLVLYDPLHPEFGSQILVVQKRDENRIWVLLPFAGGANAIGLKRVPDHEFGDKDQDAVKSEQTPRTSKPGDSSRGGMEQDDLMGLMQEFQ
jgi:hypothetical protein